MKPSADWMSWTLRFGIGFFLGAVGGANEVYGGRWGSPPAWADELLVVCVFIMGTALLAAGLASRFRDFFWKRDNYWVIPPIEAEQSDLSRHLSWISVGLGVVLIVLPWIMHS